jgi:hypothetical protein
MVAIRKGNQTGMKTVVILISLFVGIGVTAASAQWHDVGSKEIDDTVGSNTLPVTGWRSEFKKIRVGVTGTSVDFVRVVITYGSGITEDNFVRVLIRPGEFSYVKHLATGVRSIRKIEFWYEPESLEGQKAVVTLYARE